MSIFEIIILFIAVLLSFLLLHLIDYFGIKLPLQLIIVSSSVLATLVYILFDVVSSFYYLTIGFLTTPIIVFIEYHVFNWLSLLIHNEAMRLHYRGATNRSYKVQYGNTDNPFKITDSLFTFFIILGIMMWAPCFAAVCIHFFK